MEVRTPIIALGSGLTTGLLVAVLVIELLAFEFSAIIGLPVGLLAGTLVLVGLLLTLEDASTVLRSIAAGAAGFGYGILGALLASYSNLLSLDGTTTIGAGIGGAVIAVLTVVLLDSRQGPA